MYLLVDNLRLGTTYTLSVVGYNEAGEGKNPRLISLTTKSKSKLKYNNGILISFHHSFFIILKKMNVKIVFMEADILK